MRNNTTTSARQNKLIGLLKLTVLALCFMLTFGLVLSETAGFANIGSPPYDNVAEADDVEGGVNPIRGDTGEITSANFNFPGIIAGTNTWTYTEYFTKTAFNDTNLSTYMTSKTGETLVIEPGIGTFKWGMSSYVNYAYEISAVTNYLIPTFIQNLANNSNISIDAQLTARMQSSRGDNFAIKADAVTTSKQGSDYPKLSNYEDSHKSDDKVIGDGTSVPGGSNYIAFAFCRDGRFQGSGSPTRVTVSNISLTFTISMKNITYGADTKIYDGAAPKFESYGTVNPFRPEVEQSENWPMFNDWIKPYLVKDTRADGNGGLSMLSYQKDSIGSITYGGGSEAYFKEAALNFADYYLYDSKQQGGEKRGNAVDERYVSGIKKVTVGATVDAAGVTIADAAVFNVYSVSELDVYKKVYSIVNGEKIVVGYASVTMVGRTEVKLDIKFVENALAVDVRVSDYGDLQAYKRIDVKGIDKVAPELPDLDTLEGFTTDNFADINKLKWVFRNNFNASAEGNNEEEMAYGPAFWMWYYTVEKADSFEALPQNDSRPLLKGSDLVGMQPFSVKSLSVNYDFTTGLMNRTTGNATSQGFAECTGSGYYRFTIYVMDAAANFGGYVTYYSKVDCERPSYDASISSVDSYGSNKTITQENNGHWLNGTLIITLKFTDEHKGSISGNFLQFVDPNGDEHTIYFEKGKIIKFDNETLDSPNIRYDLTYVNQGSNRQDTIGIVYSGKNIMFMMCATPIELGSSEYPEYDYPAIFSYGVGLDLEAEDLITYTQPGWSYKDVNGVTRTGIAVRVDRNAPEEPTIIDESVKDSNGNIDQYIMENTSDTLNIPIAERKWYTKDWKYPLQVQFGLTENKQFATAKKVYWGFTANSFLDPKYLDANNAEYYKKLSPDAYSDMFTANNNGSYIGSVPFNKFADGVIDYKIDLMNIFGTGLRAIYVWAVDQAGNVSDMIKTYILVDQKNYSISGGIVSMLGTGNATINGKTSVNDNYLKRGDTVTYDLWIKDGYAPYKLKLDGVPVLENTSSQNRFDLIDEDPIFNLSGNSFSISIDNLNVSEPFYPNEKANILFELSYRKVINIDRSKISTTAPYNGGEPVAFLMEISDENARDSLIITYYDTHGDQLDIVPVTPQEFKIGVDIDDELYILNDNFGADFINFTIINRNAVIKIQSTQGEYGADQNALLNFSVENFSEADRIKYENGELGNFIKGLKLDVTGDTKALGAGMYAIVPSTEFKFQYYNFTIESARHTIVPKNITVKAQASTKQYKAIDPFVQFTVDTNAFASGDTYSTVFYNAKLIRQEGSAYLMEGKDDYLISRESGEDVGTYAYINSGARFIVNGNYTVSVDITEVFTITKATVNVTILPSQFYTITNEGQLQSAVAAADIKYTVSNVYAEDIEGKLYIDAGAKPETTEDNYFKTFKYTVSNGLAGKLGGKNIEITIINPNEQFTINLNINDENIVISMLKGKEFSIPYAEGWTSTLFQFDKDRFIVSGIQEFSSIEWLIKVESEFPAVRSYTVSVNNVVIKDANGQVVDGRNITVIPFTVNVTPRNIVLRPTYDKLTKTYGDLDADFNIGFTVIKDDSLPENISNLIQDSWFNGSFIRAMYDKYGVKLADGTRFDGATDARGKILGTDGSYYGFAVGRRFTCTNSNFIPVAETTPLDGEKFIVNPAKLVVNQADFKGKSKNYDGNTLVHYGDVTEAYNLISSLVNSMDDVKLAFTANYDSAEAGFRTIKFSSIYLEGEKSGNYVLYLNNGNGEILIESATQFAISYIDNASGNQTDENRIKIIVIEEYYINKNDFVLSKQYDGTTVLNAGSVGIVASNPLSTIPAGNKTLVGSYKYSQSDVSSNAYVGKLVVFFNIIKPSDKWNLIAAGEGISVEISDVKNGITVTIDNIIGAITPKVINPSDINKISAVDREYDATTTVELAYAFASNVFDSADAGKVKVNLTAAVADKNACEVSGGIVKRKQVTFGSASVVPVDNSAESIRRAKNYTVNLSDFNAYFSGAKALTVNISKAKITPNVTFADKQFDGQSTIVKGSGVTLESDNLMFTANVLTTELYNELIKLKFVFNDVNFDYCKVNGNSVTDYAGVQFDADGKVVKHDVKVSGLVITAQEGLTELFKNFEIVGAGDNLTITTGSITVGGNNGYYVIPNAAVLDQKNINLIIDDILVKSKIYDGTDFVDVGIDISKFLIGSDQTNVELKFEAKFASINVAYIGGRVTYQQVKISGAEFIDNANGALAKNYTLGGKVNFNANAYIYPAPLLFDGDISMAEKIYDGSVASTNSGIGYKLLNRGEDDNLTPGLIKSYFTDDTTKYNVSFSNAFYKDKNVNVSGGEVQAKDGTVYGINVINSANKGLINYAVMEKSLSNVPGRISDATPVVVSIDGIDRLVCYREARINGYDIKLYYYALPTITSLVEQDKYDKATHGEIYGSYIYNGIEQYSVEKGGLDYSDRNVNFCGATGKINQKEITVRVRAINQEAFTKNYDGTIAFAGKANIDYEIGNIIGLIPTDAGKVRLGDTYGEFNNPSAGITTINFIVSSLTGDAADNYCVSKNSTSSISAFINKVEIEATLKDHTVTYGFDSNKQVYSDISYSYKYSFDGSEKTASMIRIGNKLYMLFAEYSEAFPEANAQRCSINGDKVTDDEFGDYCAVPGTFTFPTAKPQSGVNQLSGCGTYKLYFITSAGKTNNGSATNFEFVAKYPYTDGDNGFSNLIIEKATIYAYATSASYSNGVYFYSKFFGDANPAISLSYCDEFGNYGFKNSDSAAQVFAGINSSLLPKAVFKIYDSESGFGKEVPANAPLSILAEIIESYGSNALFYGVEITLNGGLELANYNIELRYGTEASESYAKLEVILPEIKDISLTDRTETYTSEDLAKTVINGLKDTDEVTVSLSKYTTEWEDVEYQTAIDAAIYQVNVSITRTLSTEVDGVDGKHYTVTFDNGGKPAELTIKKAALRLSGDSNEVTSWLVFSKDEYTFNKNSIEFGFSQDRTIPKGVDLSQITAVTQIEKTNNLGLKFYENCNSMYNAGIYRVILTYSAPTNSNFESETAYVYYAINQLVIDLTVDQSGKRVEFNGEDADYITYNYDWNREEDRGHALPDLDVRYLGKIGQDGTQQYIKVTGAGTYTYQVYISEDMNGHPENYYLKGESTGIITVGNKTVSSATGSSINATLNTKDDSILLADSLYYSVITSASNGYGDSDYFNRISMYVPTIGGDQASLAAVVKITVQLNGKKVSTGAVSMQVAVPSAIKNMKYVEVYGVTPEGGLTKINYTYSNGYIYYDTDNVDSIAFINLGGGLPTWALALIIVGCLLVLAGGAAGIIFGLKAKKKRLAVSTGGKSVNLTPTESDSVFINDSVSADGDKSDGNQ